MLVLSLSGIYLWWPRNAGFLRGLRWRRGPAMSFNLHHLFGFWIAIPLAVVSATGIYLGFPQQARELLSSVAPMTPQQRGGFNAPLLRDAQLDVDRAIATARASAAGAEPAAVFFPTQQSRAWRVQLRDAGTARPLTTVMVDDRSGAASRVDAADRRPYRAMDPLDPRRQPFRRGLADRGVCVRRAADDVRRHRHDDLAAQPAGKARRLGGEVAAVPQVRCGGVNGK